MKQNIAANLVFGLAIFLTITILGSLLFWWIQPKQPLEIFILDKTVPTKSRNEHKSFHWVLTYNKVTDSRGNLYDIKDYYGFFPESSRKKDFDFKSLNIADVRSISDSIDLAYYTDLYGVYYDNRYGKRSPHISPEQKVYGGLNQNDYLLLKALKEKHKTIVTEFILLDKPTSDLVRQKTENLFDLYWEGWVGKYFHSLDASKNRDFPEWIINLYKKQNNNTWPFKKDGVVLVHKYGKVLVLESDTHLNHPCPVIQTTENFQEKYQLPAKINYSNWFDVVSTGTTNTLGASFQLQTTEKGDSLLTKYNLNPSFPAIVHHSGSYNFFYFAGDFADNPVVKQTAYFKGVKTIERWINSDRSCNRVNFFWDYYIPLMEGIIDSTTQEKESR